MSNSEELIYENRNLGKKLHKLGNKLQKLQSWLKVNNCGIWEDYVNFEKSEALKNDSKSQKI
jgi:hypothetical protein